MAYDPTPSTNYRVMANDLANQVYSMYGKNQNYDEKLNQLNSIVEKDPAAFYNARIGLLGRQMGWQTGQNTGNRNTVYQKELESLIPGAKQAGMTDEQIGSLISGNSAYASAENQKRIAEEAKKGNGWVNQNVPGGWTTVAALAAAAAAPYALPAMGLGGAGAASTMPAWATAAGKGAAIGATMGGGSAALNGGNIGQGILQGGLTGAVGGGISPALGGGLTGNMAGGALAGGTGSALRGGNVLQGAAMGGAGGALNYGLGETGMPDFAKTGFNSFVKPTIMGALGNAIGGGQGGNTMSPQGIGSQGLNNVIGSMANMGSAQSKTPDWYTPQGAFLNDQQQDSKYLNTSTQARQMAKLLRA